MITDRIGLLSLNSKFIYNFNIKMLRKLEGDRCVLYCYDCLSQLSLWTFYLLSLYVIVHWQNYCPRVKHPINHKPKNKLYQLELHVVHSFAAHAVPDAGLPYGMKFLREFYFADWWFFCVLWDLIFAIWKDWYFLQGVNFCNSQQVVHNMYCNIISERITRNTDMDGTVNNNYCSFWNDVFVSLSQ